MVNAVAVDVGNSSIKLAVSKQDRLQIARLGENFASEDIASFVSHQKVTNPHFFVCSVNLLTASRFEAAANKAFPDSTLTLIDHTAISLEIDVDMDTVGIDRLVAAWAARERNPETDLIVVDAGTAVTVDLVRNNRFCGGLIFPGPTTSFEALAAQTDALPDLSNMWKDVATVGVDKIQIGKNTRAAILAGVHQHFICGLETLVNRLQTQHTDGKVICTGGILKSCTECLPDEWNYVEGLVLNGILSIARRQASDE